MDAADFVVYNRVMGFIGRNQQIIFLGQSDPKHVALVPSLQREAVQRVYSNDDGSEYLAVVCNWHSKNYCDLMLKINDAAGEWLLLDGYEHKNGARETLSMVTVDGATALQFRSADITRLRIRSPFQTFEADTKYLLKAEVKVENLVTKSGKWADGIRLDVYHDGKDYKYVGITGTGSSNGWITVVMPFDTGANPQLARSRTMLIMNNLSGTVWFRNATIETCGEAEVAEGAYFQVGDTRVGGSVLKLK